MSRTRWRSSLAAARQSTSAGRSAMARGSSATGRRGAGSSAARWRGPSSGCSWPFPSLASRRRHRGHSATPGRRFRRPPASPSARSSVTALQACGALRFGTFTLTSGKTSSYYIDIKRAVTRPELLRMIADAMAPYARSVDRIAGVELGAVPIAAAVSLASGKPCLMVRKAAKEHGTKEDFEGELNRGDRVLFVEDVVTTGGTLRSAIDRLRAHGARIEDVVAVVDREEGGEKTLSEIGVRLHALLHATDLPAAMCSSP